MAFNVGDTVKKVTESQKYKVADIRANDKYGCKIEPNINPTLTFVFKGEELQGA